MFAKLTLVAATAASLMGVIAAPASAGYIYYPDDSYYVHPHHHHYVEEAPVYRPRHDGHYYQKKVLVGQHPTYQTCHYVTRWDADGAPLRVEECH